MGKSRRKKVRVWVIVLLTTVLALVWYANDNRWLKQRRYPLNYEDLIEKYAVKYSVDPYLAASVIWVESRFLPEAISPQDARGLMQILPTTAQWASVRMGLEDYQEEQLFEPEINIEIGTWYLSFLNSQFPDNRDLVLASYNGGIGNVLKWLDNREYSSDGKQLDHIPFPETRNYVTKVQEVYDIYREIYPSLKP